MDTTATSAPFPRRPLIASAWTGVGLINASQTVFPMRALGMHHAWANLFATLMLVWLPWALATPLVIRLGRRYPPARSTAVSGWTVHLAAVTVIGLICAAWNAALEILLNPWAQTPAPGPFRDELLPKFYSGQLTSLVLYAFILMIDYVLTSRQRMARQQLEAVRLSEQLSKAQLDGLRRQMEPHFIFNALNAISGLVRDNCNDAAVETIAVLSNFLRRATQECHRPRIALQEEMETLRQYLEIQKTRFADRLQINMHVPAELLGAQVPSLILQPLVENAIKHGISKRASGGLIQVAAASANGRLRLSVDNDGPTLPADWESRRTGIGISNLRTRLQIMYGSAFELSLRNQGSEGVQALVCLPLAAT